MFNSHIPRRTATRHGCTFSLTDLLPSEFPLACLIAHAAMTG